MPIEAQLQGTGITTCTGQAVIDTLARTSSSDGKLYSKSFMTSSPISDLNFSITG